MSGVFEKLVYMSLEGFGPFGPPLPAFIAVRGSSFRFEPAPFESMLSQDDGKPLSGSGDIRYLIGMFRHFFQLFNVSSNMAHERQEQPSSVTS